MCIGKAYCKFFIIHFEISRLYRHSYKAGRRQNIVKLFCFSSPSCSASSTDHLVHVHVITYYYPAIHAFGISHSFLVISN